MARSIFQSFITDGVTGAVVEGAQITVALESGSPVTIYEQQSGGSEKVNPFLTGSDGRAVFYAEPGIYRITATFDSITSEFRYYELGTAKQPEQFLEDFGGLSFEDIAPLAKGGTGAATAEDARSNLDVYRKRDDVGALSDITSLSSLNTAALVDGQQFHRGEFWPDTGVGAVNIKWDANEPVANHNGGTIIDPAKISELDTVNKTFGTYFTPDTVSGNTGCFVVSEPGYRFADFGIILDAKSSAAENAKAIQATLDAADTEANAQRVEAPDGDIYYTPSPSIRVLRAHTIAGEGPGALPNTVVYESDLSDRGTAFILTGDGTVEKLVRTRREYRASSGDPQDAALSVGWDIQGIGASFEDCRHELFCDYSDATQSNLGDDWDVLIMASRMGFKTHNVHFRGYPRFKHLLLDATRGVGLPEFDSSFPTDTDAKGIDGIEIIGFRSVGTSGIGLLGPKPKPGLLHPGFQYLSACQVHLNSANASDGDTVTIDAETFTFRSSPVTRYEVDIGGTATESLENLRESWLLDKQAPYEDLTLTVNGLDLEIYSLSAAGTPVSASGAELFVNELGTTTGTATTATISDPAPYYDEILGSTIDDGRNSLGASDFILDDYVITVAHHSGFRITDIRGDKNQELEPDTTHSCLHIDGMGGRIFIHKFGIGTGRFESVEPFLVRMGLCGRSIVGPSPTFDSNVTAWLSTSGGALTSADQYGKLSGEKYRTCRLSVFAHDDPGDYFEHDRDGNRVDTNFRKVINDLIAQRDAHVGTFIRVGGKNNGSEVGYVEVVSGESANSEVRFSNAAQSTIGRLRVSPTGGFTLALRPGGTGSLTDRIFVSSSGTIRLFDIPEFADDTEAGSGGLGAGDLYRDATGDLRIKL